LGNAVSYLVVLQLDDLRVGLPLASVDRVFSAVHVTPLPKAPDIVLGVISFQGRVIPVVNMRRRFRLPDREVVLTDRLVVAHTTHRPIGLLTDAVTEVLHCPEEAIIGAQRIVPGIEYVDGVVRLGDGLILIHDLDRFLSLEEDRNLGRALELR